MTDGRPRAGIGTVPTPVEAVPDLAAYLDVAELYVKNEGEAGDLYGGNKIRKLDYLLGEALEQGCSRVITAGSIGSNHVLATAAYAREVGLEPAAFQFPQPVTEHVQSNLRALAAFDPELTLLRTELTLPVHLFRTRLHTRFRSEDYYVPYGGSAPVGALGYVDAVAELKAQIAAGELPRPDVMVTPTSSGGTHAGLQVGVDVHDLDVPVVGIQVASWYTTNRFRVARLATKTAALLDGSTPTYSRADIDLRRGHIGEAYAEPTEAGNRATEAAKSVGITLDPTYTAKTVAAIGEEFSEKTVLYWHTLGESHPAQLSTAEAIERLPARYVQFLRPAGTS